MKSPEGVKSSSIEIAGLVALSGGDTCDATRGVTVWPSMGTFSGFDVTPRPDAWVERQGLLPFVRTGFALETR
jgi:hypothetical protein